MLFYKKLFKIYTILGRMNFFNIYNIIKKFKTIMIINKSIEIKISKKNIDHFLCYHKDIKLRDIIQVDPNNLQKSSNVKVDVSCDVCGIERTIKYQAYTKNINSCEEYPIYTCDKCSHVKIKSFNRKKWGVDYFSQTDEYNDKFKSTMMERYGVEYTLQSEELRDKVKKTNLEKFGFENPFMDGDRIRKIFNEKYGVNHPSQVYDFSVKIKSTNLERYGYENPLSSPVIREKIDNTNLEKYGGHPMKSDISINRLKSTNLDRYGYEYILSIPEKRKAIKNTWVNKYGVDNPMISEEVRKDFIISRDVNYIKYIGSNYSLFNCKNGHEFTIHIDNYHSRLKNNLPLCTVCYPISNSRSIKEEELYKFISSVYDGEIVQSYRDGLEIDIYLPDLKLGFEFNGLYWHSEEYKDKNYHLEKTKYFSDRDIRIIHIWEDDWNNRVDIIKSQIKNWTGNISNRIFARKCKVIEIKSSSKFLNENHIQGVDKSSLKLGLFFNNELVSVMTFDRFEGRKKMEEGGWNLSRFCNKLDMSIVGGASKLLNHFINNYKPTRIVSYADRDWSQGDLYYKLGFENVNESSPDYKYLVNGNRVHKSNFKKSKIEYLGTESEYIKSKGIEKVWDCGKIKFEIKKSHY